MRLPQENSPLWVSIPIDDAGIKAIFTTRHGGVSPAPYDTLNLSFQRSDHRLNVLENFRRLSESIGIPMEHMVLTRQVHGSNIVIVDKSHRGNGLAREQAIGDTDGLITADKEVALVTFHADCTPVYLYDRVRQVIGLVHSGWRSTLLHIAPKAVEMMKQQFHCRASDIIAVLGPHIHKECFDVGDEVYREFREAFPNDSDRMQAFGEKWKIDLSEIIVRDLERTGLARENIRDTGHCTVCLKERFFSHRGGRGASGTGCAVLMMHD